MRDRSVLVIFVIGRLITQRHTFKSCMHKLHDKYIHITHSAFVVPAYFSVLSMDYAGPYTYCLHHILLPDETKCFNTVSWVTGMASNLYKVPQQCQKFFHLQT